MKWHQNSIDLWHMIVTATCEAECAERHFQDYLRGGKSLRDIVAISVNKRWYAHLMRMELWDRGWYW